MNRLSYNVMAAYRDAARRRNLSREWRKAITVAKLSVHPRKNKL
ncbi:hypothetical protein [Paracoccus sp. JM45]|nr:hypothetical protein [Paracoccus sp. JM45]